MILMLTSLTRTCIREQKKADAKVIYFFYPTKKNP